MGHYTNKFRKNMELVECYAWLVAVVAVLGIATVVVKAVTWAVGLAMPLFDVR